MRRAAALALAAVVASVAAGFALAARDSGGARRQQVPKGQQVTLCHATGNGKYVLISASVDSVVGEHGHGEHPEDIIPPFNYEPKPGESGSYPGQNWDEEGQAIWENGCVVPPPTPPSPPPVCTATVTVTGALGAPQEQFVHPERVYVSGTGFEANTDVAYGVTHVPSGQSMAGGTFSSGPTGAFTGVLVWDGGNAWSGNESYAVEVSGGDCSARGDFQYRTADQPQPRLQVRKVVVGSTTSASEFRFTVNGETIPFETDGENEVTLPVGTYTVTEVPAAGFTTTREGCDGIVLSTPQASVPVCTIMNTAQPQPRLRVRKVIVGSTVSPSAFSFTVNGQTIPFEPDGENLVSLPPGTYDVTEAPVEGYTTTREGCDRIALSSPQAAIPLCTITNTATSTPPVVYPVGVFVKCVDNFDDGTFAATFGYYNPNVVDVTVPIGPRNAAGPDGPNRGQPELFLAGTVLSAFTVGRVSSSSPITWLVASAPPYSSTATATPSFATKCSPVPPEPEPPAVSLFVKCVNNAADTYSATFGYENIRPEQIDIPVGPQNLFEPLPLDRGQPGEFVPGIVEDAITVTGIPNATNLTWRVDSGNRTRRGSPTATAKADFGEKCSTPTPPTPPPPPPPSPPPSPPSPPPSPEPDEAPIGVFVQCVTNHGSTYDAVFGYQNDNEDLVEIAVGAQNRFLPAPEGRGQTTEFLPGNVQEAFTVKGVANVSAIVWAVTHADATRAATAASAFPEKCASPQPPAQPIGIFACVVNRGSTYDAVFGYENDNPVDITVPIGIANRFAPEPQNRGQPTIFRPGRNEDAFTVHGIPATSPVSWWLSFQGTRQVIVTASYPVRCTGRQPNLPLEILPLCVRRTGSSYTAVFAYANLNRADVIVPVGPSNRVSPAPVNRGQPTVFRPGIVPLAFAVEGIPIGQDVTWTVASAGEVNTATASAALGRRCFTTPIDGRVDLAIEKAVKPATVNVGERLVYTIVVRNKGTALAQSVTVIDRPADERVELLSAASAAGRCEIRGRGTSNERVLCFLRDLDPGESATIVVAARASEPGSSRNRASVLSLPADVGPDNTDTATVVIRAGGVAGAGRVKPPFTG